MAFKKKYSHFFLAGTAVLTTVLLYYFFDARSAESFFPQCPFNALTGLYCPGCGSQRAFSSLLHGDFTGAVNYNILMVASLPFIIYSAVVFVLNTFRRKQITQKFFYSPLFVKTVLIVVLLFWVLRNIPQYPFSLLAPHE